MKSLIVIMGVSGVGKTTVGRALATGKGWPFIEGDDHHPAANIQKMKSGIPLDDADRLPWVASILDYVTTLEDDVAVLACSALTPVVQEALRSTNARRVIYCCLVADASILSRRMQTRSHFMPPALLTSQLDALSPPEDALKFDAHQAVETLVGEIESALEGLY